jgi:hypothetical protein
MSNHSPTKQLRELRNDGTVVAMFTRLMVAELVRSSLDRLDVRARLRRKQAAQRRRRALEVAGAAFALAVAGIAARHALHTPEPD